MKTTMFKDEMLKAVINLRKTQTRWLDGLKEINKNPDNFEYSHIYIGEKQGNAKLTDEAVKILKKAIPLGLWNETDAGKLFNMKPESINDIVRGVNWKHIKWNFMSGYPNSRW